MVPVNADQGDLFGWKVTSAYHRVCDILSMGYDANKSESESD